jgi:ferredoxin
MTTIAVDKGSCIGAGNCAEAAPAYFDQADDDGSVILLKAAVEPGDEEIVDEAIELCPVRAISFVTSAGA